MKNIPYYVPEICDGHYCPMDCEDGHCPYVDEAIEAQENETEDEMDEKIPYQMNVKLDKGARMPTRAHSQDAGLDLYSREEAVILPRKGCTFDTGVHIQLPPRHFGKIESKSGLNINHDVVSCGGVIDEGYTGSIRVKLYNMSDEGYVVHKGDKIAQLVIQMYATPPMRLVFDLEETERGDNGFGSTGR